MKEHRLTTEQLELCLPERLVKCLYELSAAGRIRAADISELRLRLNRPASVTVAGVNLPLDVRLTAAELSEAVTAFCHGSYYAHGDTIREGYIRFGDGCRIDNLVQVAHNVKLGRGCILVSQTGIAGSCTLGDYVVCGGQTGFADHLNIGSGAQIAAQSGLMRDVEPGAVVMGSPAVPIKDFMRQVAFMQKAGKK